MFVAEGSLGPQTISNQECDGCLENGATELIFKNLHFYFLHPERKNKHLIHS